MVMLRVAGGRTDQLILVLQLIQRGTRLVCELGQEIVTEGMVNALVEDVKSSKEDGHRGSDDGENFDFEGNLND